MNFVLGVSAEVKETINAIQDKMGAVFLWSTVAVIVLLLMGGAAVRLFKRDLMSTYMQRALPLAVGFAVAIAVMGFALNIVKYSLRGSLVPTLVYPLAATAAAALLGGYALWLVNMLAKTKLKLAFWIVVGLVAVPFVVAIVYLSLYYRDEIASGDYYVDVSTLALVLSCVGLVVVAALVALFCGRRVDKAEHTRSIAYAGVCIALAFALSYIKLFSMPQGGSVTLASMLPIMLYSCRYGTRKGLLVGLVYGMLQAVQDPYVIHPAQFLLDYPLAFAMLGLAGWAGEIGLFGRRRGLAMLVGGVSAIFMRYIAHVLSGIFAFAAYAHDAGAASVAGFSFAYNSYVLIDGAMCLALGALMYLNKGARASLFGTPVRKGAAEQGSVDADSGEETVKPVDSVDGQ